MERNKIIMIGTDNNIVDESKNKYSLDELLVRLNNDKTYDEDLKYLLEKYVIACKNDKIFDAVAYKDLVINLLGLEEDYEILKLVK